MNRSLKGLAGLLALGLMAGLPALASATDWSDCLVTDNRDGVSITWQKDRSSYTYVLAGQVMVNGRPVPRKDVPGLIHVGDKIRAHTSYDSRGPGKREVCDSIDKQ